MFTQQATIQNKNDLTIVVKNCKHDHFYYLHFWFNLRESIESDLLRFQLCSLIFTPYCETSFQPMTTRHLGSSHFLDQSPPILCNKLEFKGTCTFTCTWVSNFNIQVLPRHLLQMEKRTLDEITDHLETN